MIKGMKRGISFIVRFVMWINKGFTTLGMRVDIFNKLIDEYQQPFKSKATVG